MPTLELFQGGGGVCTNTSHLEIGWLIRPNVINNSFFHSIPFVRESPGKRVDT